LAASLAQHPINERRKKMISIHKSAGVLAALLLAPSAWAALLTFESAGPDAAAITPTRDAFRSTVGGGSIAAANGSFGGLRREINWDGVPEGRTDPNLLPADFFNVNSPRGVVFSTPGQRFSGQYQRRRGQSDAVRFSGRLPGVQRAKAVYRGEQQHHRCHVLCAGDDARRHDQRLRRRLC
jgi:hypothetical protein